ncbi:MAG: hypothetical protein M1812_006792 [Candelaria pacifica]|nr:MAG: hypothetical protein M1812_006792 [Candelaria pacifica]
MTTNSITINVTGIGTYVTTTSLSHTSLKARFSSWYQKAKDSAVGTSFDEHVMGGYKFLMRYYMPGDELYFFGFSRGAYVARFLAEMLDYVGLLSPGNEELSRFAWKTFSQWQQRNTDNAEAKEEEERLSAFMKAFRGTFSRPVNRISFLGLFDTVNSVPRFEAAWMQRSKFPYTAKSSARVVRHAVGIDERRAKFRQDLISETKSTPKKHHLRKHQNSSNHHRKGHQHPKQGEVLLPHSGVKGGEKTNQTLDVQGPGNYRRPSRARSTDFPRYRTPSRSSRQHSSTRSRSPMDVSKQEFRSEGDPNETQTSLVLPIDGFSDSEDETEQDIQEVWFPGCHADIGGGWANETHSLSHGPLVWITREARRAGLNFDEEMMRELRCCGDEDLDSYSNSRGRNASIPKVRVSSPLTSDVQPKIREENEKTSPPSFHDALHSAATESVIHDCLQLNNGLPATSVLSWNIMEYLPFRRMDLQPDGSWKPIRWPLPAGEVRDIPNEALIHNSALKRMQADKDYRPGNLIIGGGGRGMRRAPPDRGTGDWVVTGEEGDPVGEVWVKKEHAHKVKQVTNGQ